MPDGSDTKQHVGIPIELNYPDVTITSAISTSCQWVSTRYCNPEILNPGISAVFANPKCRDWQRLNSGISELQKLAKVVLFCMLNERNKNFSCLENKIFSVC